MKKYFLIIFIIGNLNAYSQQENNINLNNSFQITLLLNKDIKSDSTKEPKVNKKKNLYNSITNRISYWAKFNYSINSSGANTINSIGFDLGLYPKIISFGKKKNFSLYIGGSVSSLYMLKSGNRLEQIKSFYNIQHDDQYFPIGTDSSTQGFFFIGGGIMAGYKMNKINPFLRISGGMYNIYFKNLKIYDSKQGMSTFEPSFWKLGFEIETGLVFYNIFCISYKLNLFQINQNDIEFLNKTYLFHTFGIGVMGI